VRDRGLLGAADVTDAVLTELVATQLGCPPREVVVTDCWVELEAERAPEPPRVFTRITMRFVVTGRSLSRTAVERAVELSAEKYCSASIMLAKTAEIVREIELRDADAT
jgi:uncharacterized OsmC-like protein